MSETATQDERRRVIDGAYDLSYDEMKSIVRACGGWLRSSGGPEGDTAEVEYDGTRYVFKDRGLTAFLYAVKDNANDSLYAAVDLCAYIAKSTAQPPSVFVRDAIVARAAALKAKIEGTDAG